MDIKKINLTSKLDLIQDYWDPKIVGALNEQFVKLAKIKGEFDWHKHDNEDELFLLIKGNFQIELRDKMIDISEGEFVIIPKGIEHRPIAKEEAHILLFEPQTTINTGELKDSTFKKDKLDWI